MPEVNTIISGADRYSYDITIIVREPLGVQKARVIDRFGLEIRAVDLACENPAIFNTGFFLRERCPFQVELTSCVDEMVTLTGPFFSPDPTAEVPMPCDPLMCHETAHCTNRQHELVLQRNLIIRMCGILRHNLAAANHYRIMLAIYSVLTFIFAALAISLGAIPFAGVYFAALFGVAAAVCLGFAIYYNERYNQARNANIIQRQEMEEARIRFDDIVREIFANCCPSCITVDVTQERCT